MSHIQVLTEDALKKQNKKTRFSNHPRPLLAGTPFPCIA